MLMHVACTFDSLTVNLQSLALNTPSDPSAAITVALMTATPATTAITGPSVTLDQLSSRVFTGTATGSMAVPAGSYVWLQIAGSALADFPASPPASFQSVIGVTSHCN